MTTYKGVVQKGTKRAAALGFPTVNTPLDDKEVSGIYAARVTVDDKLYNAAAFADQTRNVLEAHILDADLELYGKEITIELHKKIRESESFDDDNALRAAIAGDIQKVRAYFSTLV
ncbi:riboflavin kinase [Candidatus Kaiserbacteria bacterium]|nr:riboflavin kinase [Candidatus Kaiserbacteria bacterium]